MFQASLRFLWMALLLLLPGVAAAFQPEDLNNADGLTLRLIPRSPEYQESLGIKTITLKRVEGGIQAGWTAQRRVKRQEMPWPVYQVLMDQGSIYTPTLASVQFLIHPHLWIAGDVQVEGGGALWAPAKIFEPAFAKITFEPGLLWPELPLNDFPQLKGHIEAFRATVRLIRQPPTDAQAVLTFSPQELKALQDFLDRYLEARVLDANAEAPVVVNGVRQRLPAMIVGNACVKYLILKNPQNPLVLGLSFNTPGVPKTFLPYFLFFKNAMEYQITQIQTAGYQADFTTE